MPTLIRAKPRGKFRPCRSDVPKRVVAHVPLDGYPTLSIIAAGDRIDGIKLASMPATEVPVRSGVGTAHHLRRFPVCISVVGRQEPGERTAAIAKAVDWISSKLPDSKPKVLDGNRIRVVLWADEVKFVRENINGNYRVRED